MSHSYRKIKKECGLGCPVSCTNITEIIIHENNSNCITKFYQKNHCDANEYIHSDINIPTYNQDILIDLINDKGDPISELDYKKILEFEKHIDS